MKNKSSLLIFLITIMVFLVAGCSSKSTAEDVYWQYFEACTNGDFKTAENFLAENALATAQQMGVCAFTHDAINTYEAQRGNQPRTFSQDPMMNINEKVTSITWLDDQGNLANVVLVIVDGEWKVTEVTWSR